MEKEKRETKLVRFSQVGLTEECHKILKQQRKKQEKSMMEIVDELVKEKFGKSL